MNLSRREWVLAGLSMLAGGCASNGPTASHRPGVAWPSAGHAPAPAATRSTVIVPAVQPAAPAAVTAFRALPRSQWAKAAPLTSRLEAMGGVNRITVHHEGSKVVTFSDVNSTRERLELVRQSHLRRMRAGDIGYHYIIDRAGRVWEGRPVQYQGAHAGGVNNRHNIGIMVLGNFDLQSPTDAQMATLVTSLRSLQQIYKVPVSRVYTHQELSPTRCPGTHLQPRMVAMRHNGILKV